MMDSSIPHLRIGQAAKASGISTASIRFYEQCGLLSPAVRSDNGYRRYSAQDIDRLRQIRTCRSLDMSLDEVQSLLNAPVDAPEGCTITALVLRQHLQHIEARMTELQKLNHRLHEWMALCQHAPDAACPTLLTIKRAMPLLEHPVQNHVRHV